MKDAYDSACMGGANHKHLGHFAKRKYINKGHNSDGIISLVSKGIEGAGRALNTDAGKRLKAADKAMQPPPSTGDKTNRRKYLDKTIDAAEGSID